MRTEPFKSSEEAEAAVEEFGRAIGKWRNETLGLCLRVAEWMRRKGPEVLAESEGKTLSEVIEETADELDTTPDGLRDRAAIGGVAYRLGVADLDLAPDDVRTMLTMGLNQIMFPEPDDDDD